MLIFLYGQDSYRAREKLNKIIENYKKIHKSGLNLKFYDGKSLDFQDFKDETQQTSMFKEKKLAILKNVFSNQKFKEEFLKEGKKFIVSKDLILFYEEGEIPVKDKLAIFLKKNGKSQEFKPLGGEKLKNWLKKEFKKYNTEITSLGLEKLISFVGPDLWRMSNEIAKLVNYKREKGKQSKVEIEDIELLVKAEIKNDIFKTIDAIALKDKKKALSLIHQHLEKGDFPLYLLTMITFQFRNLLLMKSLESKEQFYGNYSYGRATNRLGIHPYVARKAAEQARKFSLEELKKIYHKLFEIDLGIKTGRINSQTALDLFIAEI